MNNAPCFQTHVETDFPSHYFLICELENCSGLEMAILYCDPNVNNSNEKKEKGTYLLGKNKIGNSWRDRTDFSVRSFVFNIDFAK